MISEELRAAMNDANDEVTQVGLASKRLLEAEARGDTEAIRLVWEQIREHHRRLSVALDAVYAVQQAEIELDRVDMPEPAA